MTVYRERLRQRRQVWAECVNSSIGRRIERGRESARAQAERDRIDREERERNLAHGLRRKIERLPSLWRRCLQRWPSIYVYSQAKGPRGWACVHVVGHVDGWWLTKDIERSIGGLCPAEMGLAAVASCLDQMEAQLT